VVEVGQVLLQSGEFPLSRVEFRAKFFEVRFFLVDVVFDTGERRPFFL
jgi:hypothetical protein